MDQSEQLARRVSLISVAVSAGLATLKLLVGWLAGSTAVIADGVESAADVLSSGVVFVALWVASRPPDENHPYGHGRFETLTGLGVGATLVATGGGIAWRSIQDIGLRHQPPHFWAIWPLIISICSKSVLSVFKFRAGRAAGSSALIADAWNDSVDIVSGSVALLAVGLTIYNFDRFYAADHYGGFVVGVIVVILGLQVVRETTMQLMDTMPSDRRMALIRKEAMMVPGALGVEKCYARKTGLRYHVDLHLEVDPDLTVRASHSIAEEVRNHLKDRIPWVADVLVHVEPYGIVRMPPVKSKP